MVNVRRKSLRSGRTFPSCNPCSWCTWWSTWRRPCRSWSTKAARAAARRTLVRRHLLGPYRAVSPGLARHGRDGGAQAPRDLAGRVAVPYALLNCLPALKRQVLSALRHGAPPSRPEGKRA